MERRLLGQRTVTGMSIPKKTTVMKLLEGKKAPYRALYYPTSMRDAQEIAVELALPAGEVFKTLVVLGPRPSKPLLVMVAADAQVDLKKLAKVAGHKKVRMAPQNEAERLTGLQVGGISPLALINRGFTMFLDQEAQNFSEIVISGGERGRQVQLAVNDLIKLTNPRVVAVSAR